MDTFFNFLKDGIDTEEITIIILAIICLTIIIICLWLLLREIRCWYFKINALLKNQEKQIEIMSNILYNLQKQESESNADDTDKIHT